MPKHRVALTLNKDLFSEVDAFIDGELIRSRIEVFEKFLKEFFSSKKTAVNLAGGNPQIFFLPESDIYRPLASIHNTLLIKHSVEKKISAEFQNILIIGSEIVIKKINIILGT